MFIVLLKFSGNKAQAGQFIAGHNEWIKRGMDEGVFLLVGSLQPNLGGFILVNSTLREDLQDRINSDPFVEQDVVTAEILELSPNQADKRLAFLVG
ncbi:YciI family protein [Sedimenticola sp.]|uniref:YciI family protein n=1 Tax=Sedimenticola sp. TaxID=1940285 RepID=UPI003D113ACE